MHGYESELKMLFLEWLDEHGLDPAVEVCPCDSGELLFVTGDATDYIDDFILDHPEHAEDCEELQQIASDIGAVSDFGRQEVHQEE